MTDPEYVPYGDQDAVVEEAVVERAEAAVDSVLQRRFVKESRGLGADSQWSMFWNEEVKS